MGSLDDLVERQQYDEQDIAFKDKNTQTDIAIFQNVINGIINRYHDVYGAYIGTTDFLFKPLECFNEVHLTLLLNRDCIDQTTIITTLKEYLYEQFGVGCTKFKISIEMFNGTSIINGGFPIVDNMQWGGIYLDKRLRTAIEEIKEEYKCSTYLNADFMFNTHKYLFIEVPDTGDMEFRRYIKDVFSTYLIPIDFGDKTFSMSVIITSPMEDLDYSLNVVKI